MLAGMSHVVAADKTNSPLLTVQRVFDSREFSGTISNLLKRATQ